MRYLEVLLTLASLPFAALPAWADLLTYSSEASLQATGTIVHTETFDEFAKGTFFNSPVATIDGVNYTSSRSSGIPLTNPYWTVGIDLGVPGYVTAPNDFGPNDLSNRSLDFGSGNYVLSMGFYMLAGASSPIDIVVTENGGTQVVFPEAVRSTYYGFVSTDGISRIDFDFPTGRKINWSFDNVSRGAIVPEPASVILLSSVVLAIYLVRERRYS